METDTMVGQKEVEQKMTYRLSIGTMTFDDLELS